MYELYVPSYGTHKRYKFITNVESIRKTKSLCIQFGYSKFYLRNTLSGHIISFNRINSSFYIENIIELCD